MFSKVETLIIYKLSTQLQLFNGKHLSMQQKTRPHFNGFSLG